MKYKTWYAIHEVRMIVNTIVIIGGALEVAPMIKNGIAKLTDKMKTKKDKPNESETITFVVIREGEES